MLKLLRADPALNIECTLTDNEGRKATFLAPLSPDGEWGSLRMLIVDGEQLATLNEAMVASARAEIATFIEENQANIEAAKVELRR